MQIVNVKTSKGTSDPIPVYTVDDFPFEKLNRTCIKNKKSQGYLSTYATYDIETSTYRTHDKICGIMYIWQMCIGGIVVMGRTWDEWLTCIDKLCKTLDVTDARRLVIYVHNLGYEYQFCKKFLQSQYGDYEIFAVGSRKPLTVRTKNGIELRCSWKLSNKSLEMYCKGNQVSHPKASDDLDYRIMRTGVTPLTEKELGYCVSDVLGLYEAIQISLKKEYDNLATIPLTSTGYVRRDVRKACKKTPRYHDMIKSLSLTEDTYQQSKDTGAGGNTHANRYIKGRKLSGVDSYDAVSDYPYQLIAQQYPMTKFMYYGDMDDIKFDEMLKSGLALMFRVTLIGNVKVKDTVSMPYISYSKCKNVTNEKLDNGRIVTCDTLTTAITEIDWDIIDSQYDYDEIIVSDMYAAKYGYLPEPIRDCVRKYFEKKCALKKALQNPNLTSDQISDLKYEYDKSKNLLNSIFGMMYTDCCPSTWIEREDGTWEEDEKDITKLLQKYNTSRNSFLSYPWGIWCTAHARAHLQEIIDLGDETGLSAYVDTDSWKGIGIDEIRLKILNDQITEKSMETGAYCVIDGETYVMGIFEKETKVPYIDFKTLGAKQYVYNDDKGFHITISGVGKDGAKELGNIDNFKDGFTFTKNAGMELYYNESEITEVTLTGIDGIPCTMTTASNIGMIEGEYTLGKSRIKEMNKMAKLGG